MNKKINTITGVTLIEILIGIVISSIMMGAMYTSYTAVNNTYRQVTDRAKISQAGRDVVGMMVRDIRMAGYKYFNDTIKTHDKHAPIIITKSGDFKTACDKIEIVYGDVFYNKDATKPEDKYKYERWKVTYKCKGSTVEDKSKQPDQSGKYPSIRAFAIYKSKERWPDAENATDWLDPATDGDIRTYKEEVIVDYVQDLIFNAVDEKGLVIKPPPTTTNANKDKLFKIKTVDILLNVRSTKEFFKKKKI